MGIHAGNEVMEREHGAECKRTFPHNARGFFPRDSISELPHTGGMEDDAPRALLRGLVAERKLHLTTLSLAIGGNQAYLQQYLNRGIPRVLPEDRREKLAALLGLDPNVLRGAEPGKGAPRPAEPDAVANDAREIEWLRLWRALPDDKRETAARITKALLPT